MKKLGFGDQENSRRSAVKPFGTSRYSSNLAEPGRLSWRKYCRPKRISPSISEPLAGGADVAAIMARAQRTIRDLELLTFASYIQRRNLIPAGWFEPWIWEWQFTQPRSNIRLLGKNSSEGAASEYGCVGCLASSWHCWHMRGCLAICIRGCSDP